MVIQSHCPWKSHLYDIESENSTRLCCSAMLLRVFMILSSAEAPIAIKYALFADEKGNWRVQCVSESEVQTPYMKCQWNPHCPQSSFKNRLSLPEPWRGIRDDAVGHLTVPDFS